MILERDRDDAPASDGFARLVLETGDRRDPAAVDALRAHRLRALRRRRSTTRIRMPVFYEKKLSNPSQPEPETT